MSQENKNPDVSRRRFATGAAAAAVAGFFGGGGLSYADAQANTQYYYMAVVYAGAKKINHRPGSILSREADPRSKMVVASSPIESENLNRFYGLKIREMSVFEVVRGEDSGTLEILDYYDNYHVHYPLIDWVSRLKGGLNVPRDFQHFAKHRVSDNSWILTFQAEARRYKKRDTCDRWLKGQYSTYAEVGEPRYMSRGLDGIVIGRQSVRISFDSKGEFKVSGVNGTTPVVVDTPDPSRKTIVGAMSNTGWYVKNDDLDLAMALGITAEGELTFEAGVKFGEGITIKKFGIDSGLEVEFKDNEPHSVGPLPIYMNFRKVPYFGLIGLDGKPTASLPEESPPNPYPPVEKIPSA